MEKAMRDTERNEEMTYEKILTKLGEILNERETQYGDARQSHASVAARWSAALSQRLSSDISAYDVALMMVELKLARLSTGGYHEDSLLDAANYLVIALRLGAADNEE